MIDLNRRRKLWRSLLTSIMAVVLIFGAFGCGSRTSVPQPPDTAKSVPAKLQPNISEASPPAVIQQLRQELDNYQPQVTILSPQPDEVVQDNTISVRFQVQDLPIFKNADLGLGPHLHVFLDNQPYQEVYDVTQPLVLENLSAGTHNLRVLASRPWNESFKNEAAYAQTTFHIFTKTDQNNPNPTLPLLTYNQPQDSYGAEPILLDFYLSNALQENSDIAQVRIRCTINGESFTLEQSQPIYLQGFKSGKNWVQLELLDAQGNPIKNAFNNTIRIINYTKEGKDTLSQLVRGELSAGDARGIVDPNYIVQKPTPTPTPEVTPTPIPDAAPTSEITPTPIPDAAPTPEVTPTPIPDAAPTPEATPTPIPTPATTDTPTPSPIPVAVPSPAPTIEETPPTSPPAATSTPTPVAVPSPAPTVDETPTVQQPQVELPKVEVTTPSETQPTPAKPIEQPKPGGFFNRFRLPSAGEATSSTPPPTVETETPISQPETAQKPKFGGFFNRFRRPPAVAPTPSPSLSPTLPEVIVTPSPEPKAAIEIPEALPEINPSVSPQPSLEPTTSVEEKQPSEETKDTNIPVEIEEINKPIESTKEATPESSAPATSETEVPTASEPSETPASEKTTGVITES